MGVSSGVPLVDDFRLCLLPGRLRRVTASVWAMVVVWLPPFGSVSTVWGVPGGKSDLSDFSRLAIVTWALFLRGRCFARKLKQLAS